MKAAELRTGDYVWFGDAWRGRDAAVARARVLAVLGDGAICKNRYGAWLVRQDDILAMADPPPLVALWRRLAGRGAR
jgi:hypothetical protein